ncbi:MAG: carboxylesterase/lipase family protein [Acidimicrobiia bacterium]|nr:carboxylesterase/lipase family protein [Acidimicrobiia bacterium]MYG73623.1 carboxylesterase/lipase family protein [Acidimicrobiia bacterium]
MRDSGAVVETTHGAVRGTVVDTPYGTVRQFLGIPFGKPPVGERRFCAPEAVAPWEGVLDAGAFGPDPVQSVDGPYTGVIPGTVTDSVSEDCLTLNVWVPAGDEAGLPVMVWVYGGAFLMGGGSFPLYNGARLAAEQQVVVASVNYRVGALGFMDLRQVPGGESATANCGLHDVRLGLEWIAANAANFGGDAATLTAFGESAGAGSILHLLGAPGISSIMRRAIMQSPGANMTQPPDIAAKVAHCFMGNTGVSDVAGLRQLEPGEIVAAQVQTAMEMFAEAGAMPFHPVVDGSLIPAPPVELLQTSAATDIDVLIGGTAHELRLFQQDLPADHSEQILHHMVSGHIAARTGAEASASEVAAVVGEYRQAAEGTAWTTDSDILTAVNTDVSMREPIQRLADYRAGAGSRTYMYDFRWCSQADPDKGAFHAIDLPFALDSFHVDGWREFIGADEAAEALGRGMRSAWAAFARSGDPSTSELGPWPRYELDGRMTMILDGDSTPAADPLKNERSMWGPVGGVDS